MSRHITGTLIYPIANFLKIKNKTFRCSVQMKGKAEYTLRQR